MGNQILIDRDAFSHSQIASKLWLCEELERLKLGKLHAYVYGGWIGLLPFLMLSRGKLDIDRINSFDIDPEAVINSRLINQHWVVTGQYQSYEYDCNKLMWAKDWPAIEFNTNIKVNLIINTSVEHFVVGVREQDNWFNNIPDDTYVILQSNNFDHDGDPNVSIVHSVEELGRQFPLTHIFYSGTKSFIYPDKAFDRYMIIGMK
jgi:hypothetical protein